MPFPNVDPNFETFFEPTRIWLFGKPFDGLAYNPSPTGRWTSPGNYEGEFNTRYSNPGAGSLPMPPKRLERTLRRGCDVSPNGGVSRPALDEQQFFARIYSFTYEAHYHRLPRPLLFLVNHPGQPLGNGPAEPTKFTGVEARDWNFSSDIRVWAVDRKDMAVCLDIEIGNYQEILLDSMIGSDRREEDRASRSRGDLIGRGGGSFRGDMIGPHQNK
jgi:hypothetical protein